MNFSNFISISKETCQVISYKIYLLYQRSDEIKFSFIAGLIIFFLKLTKNSIALIFAVFHNFFHFFSNLITIYDNFNQKKTAHN